jgi:probable F420-dependent oxidoreductase
VGLDHDREMLLPVAQAAERLGFDSVFAAHHVVLPYERESRYPYQRSGTEVAMSPGMQWLDPLVTLSVVAGATDRIGLGTSVLVLPYRNPVNLAAEAAALDVLSGGRFILGVGAGWMREEFRTLGLDPAERGARTDEYIEVLRALWTEDPASFQGRFVNFEGSVLATTPRTEGGRSGTATAGTASRSTRRRCPRSTRRSRGSGKRWAGTQVRSRSASRAA